MLASSSAAGVLPSVPDGPPPLLEAMVECGIWGLSPYVACEYRCVYCVTGAQGTSTPAASRTDIRARLRDELAAVPPESAIGVGSICDAYPTVEQALGITRAALEELIEQGRRFTIITKGSVVRRDVDLLRDYPDAAVEVSLCSLDGRALRRLDPRAPSADERLATIDVLADAGIAVTVSAAPWIPDVTDARAIIERVREDVPIHFGPLNVVSPQVAGTPFGRGYDQRTVNARYAQARAATPSQPRVSWWVPIPTSGWKGAGLHPFTPMTRREGSVWAEPVTQGGATTVA
jgi:hypothetical protein